MADLATPRNTLETPRNALYWLAALAAAVTIALTAAAFWLSYEHLHDVAAANGLATSPARAWAWPATVDLFIVAGELLILRASLARRVDPWAIALAASGSLGSIALNVAGVGADARPMEYVVAAVPPVAALLAFGALMRQVHEALARHAATPPATTAAGLPKRVPGVALAELAAATPPPVAEPTEPQPATGEPDVQHDEPDPSRRLLTTEEVAQRYGVAKSTVRSWVCRGRITPAVQDPALGNLYDPETLPANG